MWHTRELLPYRRGANVATCRGRWFEASIAQPWLERSTVTFASHDVQRDIERSSVQSRLGAYILLNKWHVLYWNLFAIICINIVLLHEINRFGGLQSHVPPHTVGASFGHRYYRHISCMMVEVIKMRYLCARSWVTAWRQQSALSVGWYLGPLEWKSQV